MRKITKLIIIFLTTITVCTSCYRENRTIKVELIVKNSRSDFWQQVYEGAKAAASIYEIELTYYGPEKDYIEQKEILEQSIQRKPDAIILAAADYNMMAKPMEQAVEAGISVIMVDSAINSNKWISFVSSDNRKLGESLAEEIKGRIEKSGTVGIISFVQGAYPFVDREEGYFAAMANANGLNILDTVYCNKDIDTAMQLAEEMIDSNPDLVAIAGLNGLCGAGAARALKKLNRSDIVLAAIDCNLEEAYFMEQGILDVAILQNPYLMGYYSLDAAALHLNGNHAEKNIWIDTYVINQENMFTEGNQQLIFPFN